VRVTLEEMKNLDCPFNLRVLESGPSGPAEVGAFAGWFDVSFRGSAANPNETNVELTTAPDANGATHWGQQAFFLSSPVKAGLRPPNTPAGFRMNSECRGESASTGVGVKA
jgi:protein arginine N-methyltransferase 1